MAPFSRKNTHKSSGEKSLSSMLDNINLEDESLFTFTDEELDNMISELQTSSSARSPEEINQTNLSKFESAVKGMQFCSISSDKAVLSADEVKESDKIVDGVDGSMISSAMRSSVIFAFVHGNITTKKTWIRVTHSDKGKSNYVSFPLLNTVGSRSVLVHVYREEISKFLDKGKKNTLMLILEKSKIEIKKEKRKYLFPKGHLMANSREEIDLIRRDLNHIFDVMAKPIEKREFKLEWFDK